VKKEPTYKTHVQGNEQHNGLSEENAHRTTDVAHNELLEIDFNFLLFSMYAPVLGPSSEFGRLVD
jgi:hypothetical protein